MAKNQFDLLKTKRFLPLFITQFLGAFNDNVFKNALVILITYKLSQSADANAQILVTAAAGIFILPFFLFSATAGQLADKIEMARLISYIKFVEIILMLLAAAGFYTGNITLLMATLFLLGSQATFLGPVKYAILPVQLRENELIAGNGLIEAGTFLSILMGTIFGGILILLPSGIFIISCAIIAISILGFVSSLSIPDTGKQNPALVMRYNFISETIRVIQYSRARHDIFLTILGISWFWVVGAVFLAEFPIFAKDILHSNEHVVTWFFGIFSIGIAIGSLLCNKLLKGRIHATFVPLSAIGMTLFAIDLYLAARHANSFAATNLMSLGEFLHYYTGWRISIDLLLIAIFSGLYIVPLYAILQYRSDPSHRARVIASNNVLNALFMVLAALGTLLMLHLNFTINDVFLTIAILNALVAIYICKLLPDLILKSILRMVLTSLYRVRVIGLENYDQAGERVVIIANHTSFLDAALLAAFLPDKCTFAIDTLTSKKGWIKFFLRLVDAYPLDPTNPMAIKSLIEYVRKDKKCIIFPEGRITVTGALMKVFEGPGLIADKSDAALLPICIQGAQFSPFSRMKGKMPIQFAPQITLTIFPAQRIDIPKAIKGRERRRVTGLKLYDMMTNIIFESSNSRETLFTSLLKAQDVHGTRYIIASDIEFKPITYQQLIIRSFILGKCISKNTLPGEYVGILLPNMVSTVITFFSLQAYGCVPTMLNFTMGIKNILSACHTAQIRSIYTSSKFVTHIKLTDMVVALKDAGIAVYYLEDITANIGRFAKLQGKIKSWFPYYTYKHNIGRRHLQNADQTAVVLFTSGSEGTPKGVVLSHANIQANRYQLGACIDFTENDKVFNALPLFHSFGLTGGMLLPVLSGIQVFLYPSPLHYRIVPELIYDINATIVFGTDTFLSGYAKYAHSYDFYSVRYVFSGAEKLRAETLTIWSYKFGVRIFEGYGTTETSPVLSTNTPMHYRTGTVGRLMPGIKYELLPFPGVDAGGILTVSGPNIMQGYLLASQPGTIVPPKNGRYETGDIVSIDEDGFLTITGRVKRFAKIGGEMVSLAMVEQQISTLWPLYQHAVMNMPDSKKGEQLVLVTSCPNANREELIRFSKQIQMSEISVPRKIIILSKIPLLGTGKIDYPCIKDLILGQTG